MEPKSPYTEPTRPDLSPTDPRGGMSGNNDFTIQGSIDNSTTYDVASGESIPSPYVCQ